MAVQGAVKLRDVKSVKLSLTIEMKWPVGASSTVSVYFSTCVQLGICRSCMSLPHLQHKSCCHFPWIHLNKDFNKMAQFQFSPRSRPCLPTIQLVFHLRRNRPKGAAASGGWFCLWWRINHCQQLNIQSEGPCQCHVQSNWWENFSSSCLIRLKMSNISPAKIFHLVRAKWRFYYL